MSEIDEHSLNYFIAQRGEGEEYLTVPIDCDQCGCGFKGWLVCAVGDYPEFCPRCGLNNSGMEGCLQEHDWIRGEDTKRMQWGAYKLCLTCGRLKEFPDEDSG